MLFILVQFDLFRQFIHAAVDNHTHITTSLRLLKQLLMLALSAAHNRRQQLDLRALRQFHDLIDHLVNRLLFDLFSTLRAMRHTDPRIEQSEVVVDLRHRSHRRAGIAVR